MKMKRLAPGQLTPAQLGNLAEQLPGASPNQARRLEDKLVRGFYGRSSSDKSVLVANSALPGFKETLSNLALRIFGDAGTAHKWMLVPCKGLGGRVPSKMIRSKKGRTEVKAFLIGVGHGIFQ